MGRLVTLEEMGLDATWFFDDAYWVHSGAGSYRFDWPSKNFPHQLCMHRDSFEGTLKSQIRRWIETHYPILSFLIVYVWIIKSIMVRVMNGKRSMIYVIRGIVLVSKTSIVRQCLDLRSQTGFSQ